METEESLLVRRPASREDWAVNRDRWLATVSAVQLGLGVTGLVVAVRRHRAYDLPLLHGRPGTVARDSVLMGTALSAPVVMLAAQGAATAELFRDERVPARRVLGGLGAAMVAGYLGEALVRTRLRRSGYDRLESPLVGAGIALSAAMAALGWLRT
jgi:hypothetical protein